MPSLRSCLWFDGQAEEATEFYVGLLPNSHVNEVIHAPLDYPGGRESDVLEIDFTLMGRDFLALNGGPYFTFNEAISLVVECRDQGELDYYWEALSAHPDNEQCGWLKDRYGLSWQIVPAMLPTLLADPDRGKARRVMSAVLGMKKLDIAILERAAKMDMRAPPLQ